MCVHEEGELDEMLTVCVYFIVMRLKYIPHASQQQPLFPSFLGLSASQCVCSCLSERQCINVLYIHLYIQADPVSVCVFVCMCMGGNNETFSSHPLLLMAYESFQNVQDKTFLIGSKPSRGMPALLCES